MHDPYASIAAEARAKGPRAELLLSAAKLPDPASIPPRLWLYGRLLIKGYVSVLVAPGGVGKTAWSMAALASMARGKGLAGDWVYERQNVLACTLEDPEDEFDRRLAATMMHYRIPRDELDGRVFIVAGRTRRLLIAAMDEDGVTVCYPDKERLVFLLRTMKIGLVIVDPFVNSHELDENNNPHINAAARAWAEIANEADCAVLLIHHTRKGAIAGDIEASRGAKALTDASRVGLTLMAMSADEAAEFGIQEADRSLYIRLDNAKANLAPPAKARWFKLVGIELGNGLANTPWHAGDNVQAVEEWEPPATFSATPADLNRALDAIEAGPGRGQRFSSRKSGAGGGARWCGNAIMHATGAGEGQAAKMVRAWLSTGLLTEQEYDDPVQRKPRTGVFVDSSKRPS